MNALLHLAARLLLRALALFPPAYRREYGEERAWVMEMALSDAASRGNLPLVRQIGREVRDLPPALLREHWKERRYRMNTIEASGGDRLTGWGLLVFLLPFLAVMTFMVGEFIPWRYWSIPIFGMLFLVILAAGAGLVKNLPRWALPSIGLVLGIANFLFFAQLMNVNPVMGWLKSQLWTDFMPGRVLYVLIYALLALAPLVLALVGLALLARWNAALLPFRRLLEQDWAVLPFLAYSSHLLATVYSDAYRGLAPYELFFLLAMGLGAVPFLRAAPPRTSMRAILLGTLLSGIVFSLGIYLIYPQQEWVQEARTSFPRWWEALIPLVDTAALLLALGVLALFGARFRRGEEVTAN